MQWLANVRLIRYLPCIALLQAAVIIIVTIRVNNKSSNAPLKLTHAARIFDATNQSRLPSLKLPSPRWSATRLPRALSLKEELAYIELLRVLAGLLTEAHIEFIMCDGTLLGSYVFHGFIPWDDDADVMVNIKDIAKLKRIFSFPSLREQYDVTSYGENHNGEYSLASLNRYQREPYHGSTTVTSDGLHKVKFYPVNNSVETDFGWRWPFVDIKYFKVTNNQFENIDLAKDYFKLSADLFYPLILRPFGTLWLPAPRNTQAFLQVKYGNFHCRRSTWNHKLESAQQKRNVSCRFLFHTYPFVKRRTEKQFVIEELRRGRHILHSVKLNQTYVPPRKRESMF